jgi:O-antigen/teichoic acid export membrane protein
VGVGEKIEQGEPVGLASRVRGAIIWRSGSQLLAQIITWTATFVVIRLLDPSDYGMFAMAQTVLVFLNLFNGYGYASALVQSESIDRQKISQVFGMLILLNGALAAAQLALAPVAAAYFRQPLVADMLMVQALLYLATPVIALRTSLLSRQLDFKRQAQVDLAAAFLSAAAMIVLARLGYGVWTLVVSGIVLFWTRAIGHLLGAGALVWPSFRFKGTGAMFRYGSALMAVQIFWFVQSQADVFIAGRVLSAHELGLYTTALLLTQLLTSKFVPALNDIAFSAYSRVQAQRAVVASGFLKAVRFVMVLALPFYFGLAATAEPLVLTVLGAKWEGAIPLVRLLALAMPFLTLQILFGPANNALGQAGTSVRVAVAGAIILPASFLIGINFGLSGLTYAWLVGLPLLALVTGLLSLPAIGVTAGALVAAVLPGLLASAAMALAVLGLDGLLPPLPAPARLAVLVSAGVAAYAALLFLFARTLVTEMLAMFIGKGRTAAA